MEDVSFVYLDLSNYTWLIPVCRLELALGWFGNYDGYDLAALSLLSHGPPVDMFRLLNEHSF
jgi:hypothetical protein